MQYRRRLRTRIIFSFFLLGFGLTALFALSSLYLRAKLEGQLIESTLQREVDNFVAQVRTNPQGTATFSMLSAKIWSTRNAYKMPLALQDLKTGVYDIEEVDGNGQLHRYKYAIRRDADLVSYVRYDVTSASLSEQRLVILVIGAIAIFSLLAWLIGIWSSSRVISPVLELARRLRMMVGKEGSQQLAPLFPNDEVGQLASALDDYSSRMTQIVRRDREFNADVSHELRTPLAVIRGATELLLANPDITEKMRQRLLRIDRAALQCTDLTTALLMLSRNERGMGSCDIAKLARQLVEANRPYLANKPVEIYVEGLEGVIIEAPEAVLSVAIGNLLGNACKYTVEGEVRCRVEADHIAIEDTGPGLSTEDAERLFERGYRGSSVGNTTGGGIGLSIVRRLCELYGWKVSIAPRDQGGAVAILRFS
ncbi:sensor histidine kinase [Arenimonas sp.]|jgi:signal transduction histidine kinase|uniref:sensor histidine kinase n=1 Tax=Arenimonas sp. TaxID=1872635 RepID=UPI0037BFD3C6